MVKWRKCNGGWRMSIDGELVGVAVPLRGSGKGVIRFESGDGDDRFFMNFHTTDINEAKPLIENAYWEFCESRGRELLGVSQELARKARALKGEKC